ncbi:MAG TPA: hypothetical protein ENG51_19150 [Deltaproteobacteria bacterium]|nr:hypothetical protein [Deltaproteobacteria bacterium]
MESEHSDTNELFMLLDGELPPRKRDEILTHIKVCEECKNRMKKVLSLEKGIQEYCINRAEPPCPSDRILVSYLEDRMSYDDKLEIEKHLSVCPSCRFRKEVLEEVVEELDTYEWTTC